jgi:hypothetical protein
MAKPKSLKPAKPAVVPRNYEYPAETDGNRMANAIRSQASNLTEKDREDLFKKGMQMIYGGAGNQKISRR